jgi:hypothetical protein
MVSLSNHQDDNRAKNGMSGCPATAGCRSPVQDTVYFLQQAFLVLLRKNYSILIPVRPADGGITQSL